MGSDDPGEVNHIMLLQLVLCHTAVLMKIKALGVLNDVNEYEMKFYEMDHIELFLI